MVKTGVINGFTGKLLLIAVLSSSLHSLASFCCSILLCINKDIITSLIAARDVPRDDKQSSDSVVKATEVMRRSRKQGKFCTQRMTCKTQIVDEVKMG